MCVFHVVQFSCVAVPPPKPVYRSCLLVCNATLLLLLNSSSRCYCQVLLSCTVITVPDQSQKNKHATHSLLSLNAPVSYLLLVPPSFLQLGIQAVSSRCPLLCKAADSALHEAEGLLSCPNLVQKYGEVCAEGSLGR